MSINYRYWMQIALFFLLTVIAYIGYALYNGYPIVFSDTGTYIYSGVSKFVPIDRPIVYGLFLRHVSMLSSLWFVIVVQAAILTIMVYWIYNFIFQLQNSWLKGMLTAVILAVTTSVSYNVSHLIPDIFSGFVILCFVLLYYQHKLPHVVTMVVFFITLLSILVHNTHLLFSASISFVLLIVYLFKKVLKVKVQGRGILFVVIVTAAAWLIQPAINYYYGHGYTMSRIKNIFTVGNLVSSGIMHEFLDENCEGNHYSLCQFRDELPHSAAEFLWYFDSSPLYKGACDSISWSQCWEYRDQEYGLIIKDLMSQPAYRQMFIGKGIQNSFKQFITIYMDGRWPELEGSPVMGHVKRNFSHEFASYTGSKQSETGLTFNKVNVIFHISIIVSAILFLAIILIPRYRKKTIQEWWVFMGFIITGLIINAAICGVLSNVTSRYQNRIVWLFELGIIVYVFIFLTNKKFHST
jgi:hypothetical protein